jgi:hypothetical protein
VELMAVTSAIAAVASTAGSMYMGSKQASAQKKAGRQAAREAEASRRQQDREFNRVNQKSPNIAATMTRNRAAGQGGVAGTYLTGPSGSAATGGMLGRSTLLGG